MNIGSGHELGPNRYQCITLRPWWHSHTTPEGVTMPQVVQSFPKSIIMMTPSNGNIFPRYWPFVRGIHRSSVNFPYKGQWRGALMFSLISAWTNGRVKNRDAGDLRHHGVNHNVTMMIFYTFLRISHCVNIDFENFSLGVFGNSTEISLVKAAIWFLHQLVAGFIDSWNHHIACPLLVMRFCSPLQTFWLQQKCQTIGK